MPIQPNINSERISGTILDGVTTLSARTINTSAITSSILIFTGLTDANLYKYTYNESYSAGQLSDFRIDGNTLFSNKVQVGTPTFWSFYRMPSYNTLGVKGGISIIPNASTGNNTISFHEVNGGSGTNAIISELTVSSIDGMMTYNSSFSASSITGNTIVVKQTDGGNANSAQTVDLSVCDQFTYTLTGNTIFTFSNNGNGKSWIVGVNTNPTTSGYTGTFTATTASVKWAYGITPVMTTATGKTDIYSFVQMNGIIYGDYSQSYQ